MSSRIPVPGPVIAKLERKLEMPGLTEAHTTDVLLAAESSLRKDWERPEEDEAWAHLGEALRHPPARDVPTPGTAAG